MDASELLEKYESMEEKHKELEREYNEEKVVLDIEKENVQKSRKELEELGIKFSKLKELREIESEYKEKIEEQVKRMEEILGEDEEEFEELDLED